MKFSSLLLGLILMLNFSCQTLWGQKLYSCSKGNISFFSQATIENIDANCQHVSSILNADTRKILVLVRISAFTFQNSLMQEHFNENYMESEKYPEATFSAIINEKIDFSKNGNYPVTATGKLKIHNVEKEKTLSGTLDVKDGKLTLTGSFKVPLVEHNITIPSIMAQKIAEVIDVKFNIEYTEKAKK